MSDERIAALEARVAALEDQLGAQAERERVRGQIAAALGQPGGVPDPTYTRRSVDPRELGVAGVAAREE
jgi:hypothetical protein